MSGARVGSSTCGSELIGSLEDGTLMRWLAPTPRPLSLAPPARWMCPAALARPVQVPDVSHLFNSCREPVRGLSEAAFADAARQLAVEVAAIRAVAEVESPGEAFDEEGRPRILFERHYFHRLTGGRFARQHPELSNPGWGGYGRYRAQYGKLERAFRLDPSAALQSASWGRFQIMGEHYATLGYASPQAMVQALARSEDEHLRAFVRFLKAHPAMLRALQRKDWAGFARAYNGKGYKKNAYDAKLKAAYDRLAPAPGAAPAAGAAPAPAPAAAPAPALPGVQPPVPLPGPG